jgi:hypothetical protein
MIEHEIKVSAVDYAVRLDMDCTRRDCGKDYAELRSIILSLGAFRAFEWLEKNGYKVVEDAD